MSRVVWRVAGELVDEALAALLPADCLICLAPLPWRQKGSVCLPCWERLPWAPGVRRPAGARSALQAVAWAADYDGPIRRLVQALKFEGVDGLGRHLGEAAARQMAPLLRSPSLAAPLVVPVPLHWWRRLVRGYNQAGLLAAPIARAVGVPLRADLLRRPRAGRRQLGLSRGERLRTLSDCYRARVAIGRGRSRVSLRGATVLLVDDVVTTGATLEACARELRSAGAAAVFGFALARTPRRAGARQPVRAAGEIASA